MVIYRTYRPRNFDELLGQDIVKKIFQHQIVHDSIAHAYIFSGPRGTGKTSTARLVAKALNCQSRGSTDANPCGTCSSCAAIEKGASLDVVEIDAASHRGVDNVRDNIIVTAKFQPVQSRYKVFIIDEAHMLTMEAWNALLKILEEPPLHAVFILATTELHKVPATILSRCQRILFRKITIADIVASLGKVAQGEGLDVAPEVLEAIARHADGGLRDAQSVLEQLLVFKGERVTLEHVQALLPRGGCQYAMALLTCFATGDEQSVVRLCREYNDAALDARMLVDDMIALSQAALVCSIEKSGSSVPGHDAHMVSEIQRFAETVPRATLIQLIERLIEASQLVKKTAFPFLLILVSLLEHEHEAPSREREAPSADKDQSTTLPVHSLSAAPVHQELVRGAEAEPTEHLHGESLADMAIQTHDVHIETEKLRADWDAVIGIVKEGNHSLPFIMRKSIPHETAPGKVVIAVEFAFHKDTLDKVKNKQLIEDALATLYRGKFVVEVIIVERKEVADPVSGEKPAIVNDILSEFGGMVIG